MEVQILNTISDSRVIDKVFETVAVTQCEPFGVLDIDNPTLRVKPFTGFASANYFYIPDFLRYYVITGVKRISGNILEISGTIDVLSTYKDVIKQCPAICVANENIGSTYVIDPNLPLDVRKTIVAKEFPTTIFNQDTATQNTRNFVLTVAGGETHER